MIVSALLLASTFADGNLEKRSTPTRIYTSLLFSSGNGPAKSHWISSFASTTASKLVKFVFPDITLTFSPFARHSLQFCAAVTISLWRYGYHICLAASNKPPCPGCVKCIESRMICLSCLILLLGRHTVARYCGRTICCARCKNMVRSRL